MQSLTTVAPRTLIVLNPRSGSAPDEPALMRALAAAHLTAEVMRLAEGGDVRAAVAEAAAGYDTLVAAGGDGTVSSVAAVAADAAKTLGVIPGGTLNHFARDVEIPGALDDAVAVIAGGRTRLLDVGVVNDRIFINNASIGAYPRMVWERNRARRRGIPKPLASAMAVAATWLELRNVVVRLDLDGRQVIRRSPFVFVGNSEYQLEGTRFGHRARMTDGKLSLYVAPGSGRLDALAIPARAFFGKLAASEKFEAWMADAISMELAGRTISVALDGEVVVLETPLRFALRRQVLRTLVPGGGQG